MFLNNCILKIKPYFTATNDLSPRNNNFNIIRFFASILVIYGHMAAIMQLPGFTVYNQPVSTIGVKIFFILSGYLIAKSYVNDSNFLRYILRRIFRIFPGLIGVTLFAFLIIGPLKTNLSIMEYFTNPDSWLYLKNILLFPNYVLPGVFGGYLYPVAVNGSLWSLPVEFLMYLLLPLVFVFFKKSKSLKWVLIGTIGFFVALNVAKIKYFPTARFVLWGTNWPDGISLASLFFIGCLFSLPEIRKFLNLQLSTALFIGGAFFSFNYPKTEILLAITLPYFVLSFSLCERPIFSSWFKKCDFSYGLYLYAFPIQQMLFNHIRTRMDISLNAMTAIAFIATLVCAIVSWYLIEKPFQQLGQKLVKKLADKPKLN